MIDDRKRGDDMRLLLTGDSLFARREDARGPLVNTALTNRRGDLSIDNTAISGEQTPGLRARVDVDILLRPHADWVFILIGTNDAASHKLVSLPVFAANMMYIVTQTKRRYAGNRIVLITPPPVDEAKQPHRNNVRINQYGDVLRRLAVTAEVQLLDLYQLFMAETDMQAVVDGSLHDGLHFGKYGYGILADAMLRLMAAN